MLYPQYLEEHLAPSTAICRMWSNEGPKETKGWDPEEIAPEQEEIHLF